MVKECITYELKHEIKVQGVVDGKNDFLSVNSIIFNAPTYHMVNKDAKKVVRNLMRKFKSAYSDFMFTKYPEYQEGMERMQELARQAGNNKSESQNLELDLESDASDNDDGSVAMVAMVLNSSTDIDLTDQFREFLSKGVCQIKGQEKPLNLNEIDTIDYIDLDKIMHNYIGNFFFQSWTE